MLEIRDYNEKDVDSVMEIIRLNTPKFFAQHEEQKFYDFLKSNIEMYYVYKIDEKIVGSAGLNFSPDKKEAFLSWGIVHPTFQGKGIGKQMTNHLLDILKGKKEVEKISLKTAQFTDGFYAKRGFKEIKRVKDFWAEAWTWLKWFTRRNKTIDFGTAFDL
jgi:ribosomal-protein-alanine N-acetyltransferase